MSRRVGQAGWRSSRRAPAAAVLGVPAGHRVQAPIPHSVHPEIHGPDGFSAVAPILAVALLALVAARIAEIIPGAQSWRPSLLATIAAAGLVMFRAERRALRQVARNPLFMAFAAYFLWAQFTAPFALWPGYAVKTAAPTFAPGLVMLVVLALCPPTLGSLDRMVGGLVAAFGVHFGFILTYGVVARGRLYSGGSMDPNDLASCAAVVFPMAAAMVMRGGWRTRVLGAVMVVLSVYFVLHTASRGGTLALGAGALTLVLLLPWRRRVMALVALAVAVPVIWSAAPPVFQNRIRSLTSLEADYNTTDYLGRKAIWKRARMYTMQHPVTGVGLGNFPVAEGAVRSEDGSTGKWSAAHNAYLQAFAEFGIPGGSIFVALLLLSARWFWPLARRGSPSERRPELLAGLSAFAVGAIFLSHAYFWLFFGLVGLAALAAQIERVVPRINAAVEPRLRRGGRVPAVRPGLA